MPRPTVKELYAYVKSREAVGTVARVRDAAAYFRTRQTTIADVVEDGKNIGRDFGFGMDLVVGYRTFSGHGKITNSGDYEIEVWSEEPYKPLFHWSRGGRRACGGRLGFIRKAEADVTCARCIAMMYAPKPQKAMTDPSRLPK